MTGFPVNPKASLMAGRRAVRRRPELRLLIVVGYLALCVTWAIAFLLNLNHFDRAVEFTFVALGVCGATYAVFAMFDAHRAFQKSKDVEEAVGSFRRTFKSILEEMVLMIRNATTELRILIPTPGYGYLFDETELSEVFVTALEAFLGRPETRLELCLVLGPGSRTGGSLPQRYLARAQKLEMRELGGIREETYVALVERVFALIAHHPDQATCWVLDSDPNVRIILADADNPVARRCLLSFAQSNPDNIDSKFEATGFVSTRAEMVAAVSDLLSLYRMEIGTQTKVRDTRSRFTVRT